MLPPGEFVPLAQQAGLMPALTAYVLESALAQHVRWRAAGLDLGVAVNVSATNLLQQGWKEGVLEALERRGVDPGRLVLEITEDVLVGDDRATLDAIRTLAEAGVRISVDDFGRGHSSLAYLKHLPVRELKIDRVFVSDLTAGSRDEAIVQTMIDLGRRLGIDVVAEGVEDAHALERLRELGATAVQGFHVARPQPPDAVGRLLGADTIGVLGLGAAPAGTTPSPSPVSPRRSPAAP
jgi:EAL domain-containing protein (putative c-di-GMP-specific phosphodiesterase class I)